MLHSSTWIFFIILGFINSHLVASVDDCEWATKSEEIDRDRERIICHLKAINSNDESTNFSAIPMEQTVRLTIRCIDENTSSRLEPVGFAKLIFLEELVLEGCRLENLPKSAFNGLHRLRTLSISSTKNFKSKIAVGAFDGLNHLENLDLSGMKLRNIPKNELCKLSHLKRLNLTQNEIGSLTDIGRHISLNESKNCLPMLEVLDLSHNEITALNNDKLAFWPLNLKSLYLQHNFIRFIETNLFQQSSSQLELLDLDNNQISKIPNNLFKYNNVIRELRLSNNSISLLDSFCFDGLAKLELLKLSGNLLVSNQLFPSLFTDLQNLKLLDLSRNQIDQLPDVFAPLNSLNILNLDRNNIALLPENVFRSLLNLTQLNLSFNKLQSINSVTSFNGLDQLTNLHLDHNTLTSLDQDEFSKCNNLVLLDLSHNLLKTTPNTTKYLRKLQILDLSHNQIEDLHNASFFFDINTIWRLQLNNNKIRVIPAGLFSRLFALQILDLSSNYIEVIETGTFDLNPLLTAVRLDTNSMKSIKGLFQNLVNLMWLNVSNNEIIDFDFGYIPKNLQWLDLSHNAVSELLDYQDKRVSLALNVLDISFNKLVELGPHSIPDGISILLANDNLIRQIVPYTFFKKQHLQKVDLTVNNLKTIDRNSLRLSADITTLPNFLLGGNPIECNCEMIWFKTINSRNRAKKDTFQNYPHVLDIESIYCRLVYTRDLAFVPMVEADPVQFLCPYKTHCFALCKCCDFDACDCEMTCPNNCTCYHDNTWSKNIAECSSKEFKALPKQLPMDATEIFLDGNLLPTLTSHTFIGRKNLRILHLNNTLVKSIENNTFNGLKSLSVLHLEGNHLKRLDGFEFKGLTSLRELYLQNNLLNFIHNSTFKVLHSLEILFLHGNHLLDFPVWQLSFNPFLIGTTLANNLWDCNCDFLEAFHNWLIIHSEKVFDHESITCFNNEFAIIDATKKIFNFNVSSCDGIHYSVNAIATTRIQEFIPNEYLTSLAASLSICAVCLLLLLLLFLKRNSVRVWLNSKQAIYHQRNCFVNIDIDVEDDQNKLFDAFIFYSVADATFVSEVLSTKLEQSETCGRRFNLCLYHRDLPNSNNVSGVDTLLRASRASRKTILVLSNNYIRTEWDRFDSRYGLSQILNIIIKKKDLIIILMGDIASLPKLDSELQIILKTSSSVIQWGESQFWPKLRRAMPSKTYPDDISKISPLIEGLTYDISSARNCNSSFGINSKTQSPLPCIPGAQTPVPRPYNMAIHI